MSRTYNDLFVAAFRIAAPADGWRRTYQMLRFPERWKGAVEPLVQRRGGNGPVTIPISALNATIAALIPDVVVVARGAAKGKRPPWLYSEIPVAPEVIHVIAAAWVRSLGADPSLVERALAQMDPKDVQWEPATVDFGALTSTAGSELFNLLPHELAAGLAAPGMACPHPHEDDPAGSPYSRFRRTPNPERGAVVLSWPPHGAPNKPFSFCLRITGQTRAFDDVPLIHVSVGVRRWVHKRPMLNPYSGHGVYLLTSVPWIKGVEHSPSFLHATIQRRMVDKEPTAQWKGKLLPILDELGIGDTLPDPDELRTDPMARLWNEDDAAALVYSEGMHSKSHPVSSGVSVADRRDLLNWVTDMWKPHLTLASPLRRPRERSQTEVLPSIRTRTPAPKQLSDEDAAKATKQLRAQIAAAIGRPELGVEIYHDATIHDHALTTLEETFGITVDRSVTAEPADELPQRIHTEELDILLRVTRVGAITTNLTLDHGIKKARDRLRHAVDNHASTVQEHLREQASAPTTICLVEVAGKDRYKNHRRPEDPKFAARLGMARANRHSQFVTPWTPSDDEDGESVGAFEERLRSSWGDLLRQLGARRVPLPSPRLRNVRGAPAYLAIWLVRQNEGRVWGATRQVPVALLVDPAGEDVRLTAPDLPWTTYRAGLLEAARNLTLDDQRRGPEQVTQFVERIIRETTGEYPDMLLLTCAQNLRSGWKALQNSKLDQDHKDHLTFGSSAPTPISDYPGLRHVNVRMATDDETPECYGVDGNRVGQTMGVWPMDGDRLFGSTADRPVTMQKANHMASKIRRWKQAKKDGSTEIRNPSLKKQVWNQQLLELMVAAVQQGDDPTEWATLAHDLRWAADHSRDALILPWPLHLAKKVGEYIVPIEQLTELEAAATEDESGDDYNGTAAGA